MLSLQNTFCSYEQINKYHMWWFGKQKEMSSLNKLLATKICDQLKYLLREKHEWKIERILALN